MLNASADSASTIRATASNIFCPMIAVCVLVDMFNIVANCRCELFVCRAEMEADLKSFVRKKHNLLGEKIDSRLADIEQLTKDQSLILK